MSKIKNKKLVIGVIVLLILIAIVGVIVFFSGSENEQEERFVMVTGVVIDPLGNVPIAGVDLVVGDTSIRTADTGQFVFPSVSTKTGIRLTHPKLLRAIVKLPDSREGNQTSDILFDVPLYNTLITVIDQEARGNVDVVYEHLSPRIQALLSREEFRGMHERLFTEENITNQEIVIREIRRTFDYHEKRLDIRFDEVIEFEVLKGDAAKWYRFASFEGKDGLRWWLIF